MTSKRVRSFLLNLVGAGAVIGTIHFSINKQRELQEHSLNFQRSGYCGPEIEQLQNWCETNYFSWYAAPWRLANKGFQFLVPYSSRKKVKSIEEICQASQQDEEYYQHHLTAFLKQLNQNREQQQQLEKMIYSSPDEIIISVHYEKGAYQVIREDDPSDPYYRRYLTDLSRDPTLQQLITSLLAGEEVRAKISQRADQLLSAIMPQNNLEKWIVESLREKFQNNEAVQFLYEFASDLKGTIGAQTRLVASLKENILASQEVQALQERVYRAKRQAGVDYAPLLTEMEENKQELATREKKLAEEQQNLLNTQKRRTRFQRRYASYMWTELHQQLVRYHIQKIRPAIQLGMIADGHTHPLLERKWQEKSGDEGPSLPDIKGSYGRPKIVWAAYADHWEIYSVVCGKVKEERNYPHFPPKSF